MFSLPWVRTILIKQARPILASHAPKDRIIKVFNASRYESLKIRVNVIIRVLSVIASRFRRHIRK